MKQKQYETHTQILVTPNTQGDEALKALVKKGEEITKELKKQETKKGRWTMCCGHRVWVEE